MDNVLDIEEIEPLTIGQNIIKLQTKENGLDQRERFLKIQQSSLEKQREQINEESKEIELIKKKLEDERKHLESEIRTRRKEVEEEMETREKDNRQKVLNELENERQKLKKEWDYVEDLNKQLEKSEDILSMKEQKFQDECKQWKIRVLEEKKQIQDEYQKLRQMEEVNKKKIQMERVRINEEYSSLFQMRAELEKQAEQILEKENEMKKNSPRTQKSLEDEMILKAKEKELEELKVKFEETKKRLEEKEKEVDELHQKYSEKNHEHEQLQEQIRKSEQLEQEAQTFKSMALRFERQIQELEKKLVNAKKNAEEAERQSEEIRELVSSQSRIQKRWQAPSPNKYFGKKDIEIDNFERKRREFFKQTLMDIRRKFGSDVLTEKKTCFVSYAWGEEKFRIEVERLVSYLELAGFTIPFDKRNQNTPTPQYIQNIYETDRVVVIGTNLLLQKYNWRPSHEGERQPVVRAELNIVNEIIQNNELTAKKVKPVLFEGTEQESLPRFLRTSIRIDFVRQDYYEAVFELIEHLFEIDFQSETMRKIRNSFDEKVSEEISRLNE